MAPMGHVFILFNAYSSQQTPSSHCWRELMGVETSEPGESGAADPSKGK